MKRIKAHRKNAPECTTDATASLCGLARERAVVPGMTAGIKCCAPGRSTWRFATTFRASRTLANLDFDANISTKVGATMNQAGGGALARPTRPTERLDFARCPQ
jgi:hypothetical protein